MKPNRLKKQQRREKKEGLPKFYTQLDNTSDAGITYSNIGINPRAKAKVTPQTRVGAVVYFSWVLTKLLGVPDGAAKDY